jgi:hypothetical protein
LAGFTPGARYQWVWFNPRRGGWLPASEVVADPQGRIVAPAFPEAESGVINDWAAKLILRR